MSVAPWTLNDGLLMLSCHVQPGARHNRIVGLHDQRLKIQLKAAPVEGKANAMLIRYLAELLTLPRAQITIKQGHKGRQKTIQIKGISEIPAFLHEFVTE